MTVTNAAKSVAILFVQLDLRGASGAGGSVFGPVADRILVNILGL